MTGTPRYNPAIHHRRSIRLRGYDYSQAGAYFITICTYNRECLFGEVDAGDMKLNETGQMVALCWNDIPAHFPHTEVDAFIVMPNHVHGILSIVESVVGATIVGAKNFSPLQSQTPGTSKTIGSVIRGFKIGVSKWMHQDTATRNVWQRNYWEHIIRNETEFNRIRKYILNNPVQWESDKLHPCKGEKFFAPTIAPTETREPGADYGLGAWTV